MLTVHVLQLSCSRKKAKNLFQLSCYLEIRQIQIQLITGVWNVCEKVIKILIADLDEVDEQKQQLRIELAKLDHVVTAAGICQRRRRWI